MSVAIFAFVATLVVLATELPKVNAYELCPDGWREGNSTCYKIDKRKRSWHSASIRCYKQNAHLVKVDSVEESKTLFDILFREEYSKYPECRWEHLDGNCFTFQLGDKNNPNQTVIEKCLGKPTKKAWVGGYLKNKVSGSGTEWSWLDNTLIQQMEFQPEKPENSQEGEYCLYISDAYMDLLNSTYCISRHWSVCEKPMLGTETTTVRPPTSTMRVLKTSQTTTKMLPTTTTTKTTTRTTTKTTTTTTVRVTSPNSRGWTTGPPDHHNVWTTLHSTKKTTKLNRPSQNESFFVPPPKKEDPVSKLATGLGVVGGVGGGVAATAVVYKACAKAGGKAGGKLASCPGGSGAAE